MGCAAGRTIWRVTTVRRRCTAAPLLSTQQGLWAKDGNNFVYIERVKGDEELGGISIYAFNENRRLQSVRYAATAKFDPEHKVWRLSQVDESDLTIRNRLPVRRR